MTDIDDIIARVPSQCARDWLRRHPEFIQDQAKAQQASRVHMYLVQTKGIEPFSRSYFKELEAQLGLREADVAVS